MKFQKGNPKPTNSGRQKGTPNKRKLEKVADILAAEGVHPAREIFKLIMNGDLKDSERLDGWNKLLAFCQGKPASEIESDGGDASDAEFLETFKDVDNATLLKLVEKSDEGA